MGEAFLTELSSRGVIAVSGPDAREFLQNLVTGDMEAAAATGAGSAALLAPQGKILFDFLYFLDGETVLIDVSRPILADLARRLGFYKLRAKVTVEDRSESHAVVAAWGGDTPPPLAGLLAPDPRLAALGWRAIVPRPFDVSAAAGFQPANEADHHRRRIALGVPEGGLDYAHGEVFPHEADLDQLGGVSFRKGCYVGQEVVSRMEHRGTARRRFIRIEGDGALPERGTPVVGGDVPLGVMGSSDGAAGLALIRLDRAQAAMAGGKPILAGDVPVRLALPEWARFTWPGTVDAE